MREGLVLIGLPVGDLPATLSVGSRLSIGTARFVHDVGNVREEITILIVCCVCRKLVYKPGIE